ncbi:hypothetical protein ACIG47_01815 [Promicromonospora sp. NPDC052451]|uniref:hypothetical protein n=1 Tax=Promicromonospora sp. NPDC052451 TaxID=3364407 RepID=UPI0037CA558B
MSLWGPAAEAEIEYRQAELRKAWGGRRTDDQGRAGRRAERRADQGARHRAGRRTEHRSRAEQIQEGIAGMRPAPAARHGLFA